MADIPTTRYVKSDDVHVAYAGRLPALSAVAGATYVNALADHHANIPTTGSNTSLGAAQA